MSLSTTEVLSAGGRCVVDKQPLIGGGLAAAGDRQWLELVGMSKSGNGPTKNLSSVSDDKLYFWITSSCKHSKTHFQNVMTTAKWLHYDDDDNAN